MHAPYSRVYGSDDNFILVKVQTNNYKLINIKLITSK